jgi:hypothetical protein
MPALTLSIIEKDLYQLNWSMVKTSEAVKNKDGTEKKERCTIGVL